MRDNPDYSSASSPNGPGKKSKQTVVSGSDRSQLIKALGGIPPEKDQKAIASENTPGKAPGSVSK